MLKINREFIHKHKNIVMPFAGLVFLFFVVNAALAIIYHNAFLPFTKVNGLSISGQTLNEVQDTLDNSLLQSVEIEVLADMPMNNATLQDLGYEFETSEIEKALSSRKSRVAPLVDMLLGANDDTKVQASLNEEEMAAFIGELKVDYDTEPLGERLEIAEDGSVSVMEGTQGVNIDVAGSVEQVKQSIASGERSVTFSVELTDPQETELSNADEAVELAESILIGDVTVEGLDEESVIDMETRQSWIDILYEDQTVVVSVNREKVNQFVAGIASSINSPSTKTVITTLDGVPTKTESGVDGVSLDSEQMTNQIIEALSKDSADQTVEVVLSEQDSPVEYVRTYSDGQTGLQAKISDWTEDHGGSYGVVVQQLDGDQLRGSYRASSQFVAASTYKLYVIYAVLDKVDSGSISLSEKVENGMTVRDAIYDAIVFSGNESAIDLAEHYGGWDKIDTFIAANGFGSTFLNNYTSEGYLSGDKKTTAADLSNFLERLNAGTLLSSASTKIMLDDMAKQIYRQGINSGVDGEVASKVGFLEGYLHDAALVYGDTDYVMVILTSGSSWANIADLAELVDDHLE